ncbi:MAG: hypothetical protein AB1331_07035 [Bacillota bacterium]
MKQIAAVIVIALALLGLAGLAGAEPAVSLKVEVGYEGRAKITHWMPVWVTATNNGTNDMAGELRVVVPNSEGTASSRYTTPVVLPAGTTKEFRMNVPFHQFGRWLDVELFSGGRVVAAERGQLSGMSLADLLVGVLGTDSATGGFLSNLKVKAQMGRGIQVVRLDSKLFPETASLMKAFDLVMLNDYDPGQLSQGQLATLSAWVQAGGTLVVGGGDHAASTIGRLPAGLRPLDPDGTRTLAGLSALGNYAGAAIRDQRVVATVGQLAPETKALASQNGVPVLAVRRAGQGQIIYFATDLAMEPLRSWDGNEKLWNRLLTEETGILSDAYLRRLEQHQPWVLVKALSDLAVFQLPPVRALAVLVIIYLLLIGPVNYWVLRRLDRREWSWATVPLLALVIVVGVYSLGFKAKGLDVITSDITVMVFEESSNFVNLQTYIGVFAPSRNTVELSLEGGSLVTPVSLGGYDHYYGTRGRSEVTTTISLGSRNTVTFMSRDAYQMRTVRAERTMVWEGRIEADLVTASGRLVGRIVNRTGLPLTDCVLLGPAGLQRLGDLAPGAEVVVDFDPAVNLDFRGPVFQRIFEDLSYGPRPGKAEREAMRKRQILEGVMGYGSELMPADLAFIGWSQLPVTEIASDNRGTQFHTTLVLAKVGAKYTSGGRASVPAGLVYARWAPAMPDEAFSAHYNKGGYVPSGRVTLEVDLPGPGIEWENVVVHTWAMPHGGREYLVEIYNARRGAWETLGSVLAKDMAGQFPLGRPDPYLVAPGTIRLRLSAVVDPHGPKEGSMEIIMPTVSAEGRLR